MWRADYAKAGSAGLAGEMNVAAAIQTLALHEYGFILIPVSSMSPLDMDSAHHLVGFSFCPLGMRTARRLSVTGQRTSGKSGRVRGTAPFLSDRLAVDSLPNNRRSGKSTGTSSLRVRPCIVV